MLTLKDLTPLLHRRGAVVTSTGERVGSIGEVYLNDVTDEPVWVTVRTGSLGTRESLVPVEGASISKDELLVSHSRDQIAQAPSIDRDGQLSPAEESELYAHYGVARPATAAGNDTPADQSADEGPQWMTRSEERLRIGLEQYEAARVRLRKHIVVEDMTLTVPLTRETLRIEHEPVTTGDTREGTASPVIREEVVEVVLREEHAVVTTETVPVERVRLRTETVVGRVTVNEPVRKERLAFEDTTADKTIPSAPTAPSIVRKRPNAILKNKNKRR